MVVCVFGIMCTSERASGQCSVNGGHLVTVTDFDALAGHCPACGLIVSSKAEENSKLLPSPHSSL